MIAQLSMLGLLTAFGAGLISFLTPCVLPLVPAYISYVAGQPYDRLAAGTGDRVAALRRSLLFVGGFSTIFIALGASATAVGRLLLAIRYEANLVAGAVVILFGVLMIGVVTPAFLQGDWRLRFDLPAGRPLAAFVLGLAFAFGWTPCIGPVLGAILTMSAVSATVSQGVVLLGAYSLGLGVPFLLTALFADRMFGPLRRIAPVGRVLQIAAGAVVVVMGVAIMTGELSRLSFWLLETFPIFMRLG
ncbi:MAG TPA: cytochrome c biogenesis protein CcdA [Stellaceae bacterium]|nr:cytochrome c biogenesis protein CcdA [Stellaceae bacterium]